MRSEDFVFIYSKCSEQSGCFEGADGLRVAPKYFQHFRIPQTNRILRQVDIDSYDGPLVEECLRLGLRPKILQMEINAGLLAIRLLMA